MKKLLSILVTLSMLTVCVSNVSANGADTPDAAWAVSITAANFADESEGVVWIEGGGNFDYGWGGVAPDYNFYNSGDTFKILIDGYVEEEVDSVSIKLGRLSFSAWNFVDDINFYSNAEGAQNDRLTAKDFTDGQLIVNIPVPGGLKPAADYIDENSTAADSARLWTLQLTGSSKAYDTYMNIVIDFNEVTEASLRQVQTVDMDVYPNPVKAGEKLYLDASQFSSEVAIDVYSLSGQCVSKQLVNAANVVAVEADFAPGIYTVSMSDGSKRAIQKLVVK